MISDFHFTGTENTNMEQTKELASKTCEIVTNSLDENEELFVINLGDVIDKGDVDGYSNAIIIYKEYFGKNFPSNTHYVFVPGNHDLKTEKTKDGKKIDDGFCNFDDFIRNFTDRNYRFSSKNAHYISYDGVDFILANSIFEKDYKYASLDASELNDIWKHNDLNNPIFVAHHDIVGHHDTPFNEDNRTVHINNQTEFEDIASHSSIKYFLHGHTHIDPDRVYNEFGVNIIGVGPAFDNRYSDCPQFNLIGYNNRRIIDCYNYSYNFSSKKYLGRQIFGIELPDSIEYKTPENYINRKVLPYNDISSSDSYFLTEGVSLVEVLQKDNHIVLLSEAGSGKTYELQALAKHFEEKEKGMVPFLFECRDYCGEEIQELIPSEYEKCELSDIVYIFDGYDEITSQLINIFKLKLNKFSRKYKNAKIIVSSRTNFYISESQGLSGTLEGYSEYGICPLSKRNIIDYLTTKGIDVDSFYKEIENKSLAGVIKKPFYFKILAEYFIENKKLPVYQDAFETIVLSHIKSDIDKYKYKDIDIRNNKQSLIGLLSKVAFVMQCLNQVFLTDDDYQVLFVSQDRELLAYSGLLFQAADSNWRFQHNIFREYLAAKYLSKFDFEKIKEIISLPSKRIKPSWLNTVSFLVNIYENKKLIQWIADNDFAAITDFESDKLTKELKQKVYFSVYNYAKTRSMRIELFVHKIANYVSLQDTPENIEFLLNELETTNDTMQIHNILTILEYKNNSNLYNKEKDIVDCLLRICKRESCNDYIKKRAIYTINTLSLECEQSIQTLVDIFCECDSEEVLYELVSLIVKNDEQEHYLDYIINAADRISIKHGLLGSFGFELEKAVCSIKSIDSIKKALDFLVKNQMRYHDLKKCLNYCCESAVNFYLSGTSDFYNVVFELLIYSFHKHARCENELKSFFVKTNTVYQAYLDVLKIKALPNVQMLFIGFLDEKSELDYAEKYKNDQLGENSFEFLRYVRSLPENSKNYDAFVSLIKDKEGVDVNQKRKSKHETLSFRAAEQYLNSLFNINDYQNLIEKLFVQRFSEEITIEALRTENINYECDNYRNLSVEHFLKSDILFGIPSCFSSMTIKQYFEKEKDEKELLYLVHDCIQRNKTLKTTEEQQNWIEDVCKSILESESFYENIEYHSKGFTASGTICAFASFSSMFRVKYSSEFLERLIYLPSYIYNEFNYERRNIPQYVLKNYDFYEIKNIVQNNLKNQELFGDLAMAHIGFCNENSMEDAIDLAVYTVKDSEYLDSDRIYCIDYLKNILNEEEIVELLLPSDDVNLNAILFDKLSQKNNDIENTLVNYCKSFPEDFSQWKRLFKYNNEYILRRYVEYCKKNNSIPDYSDSNTIADVTEALQQIDDTGLIDILCDLLIVIHNEGFKDSQYFGISNSLYNVLKNMISCDFDLVYNHLVKIIEQYKDNKSICKYCYNIIYDGEVAKDQKTESCFSIDEIKQMIA